MKRTTLEKHKGKQLTNRMKQTTGADRFGREATTVPDRKTQRRLDQAAGLVPFAVKLPADLVARLRATAEERDAALNDVVADLLSKALK